MGVDYLVFDTQGPFAHTLEEVIQIRDWLSGPQIMLRFGNEPIEERQTWLDRLQPAAVIAVDLKGMPSGIPVLQPASGAASQHPTACQVLAGDLPFTQIGVLDHPEKLETATEGSAWWLGAFSLTSEGLLDYEACDSFLQDHSPAMG